MSVSLHSLVAVVSDTAAAKEWIDRLEESRVLKRISETEAISYTLTKLPWPLQCRDNITISRMEQDQHSKIITYRGKGLPDYLPKKPEVIRTPVIETMWRFIPLGAGKVKVIHQAHIEPGGNVPTWAINFYLVDIPYNTMVNFMKQVKKDKYRNVRLRYIN